MLAEARRLLTQHPDRQMPLGELRASLEQALNLSGATIYAYVKRLPQLESFPDPAGGGKLVRLVETGGGAEG